MHDIHRREVPVRPHRSSRSDGSGRFPALDGMRGAAVLAVLFYHFTEGFPRRSIEPGAVHGLVAQLANVSWCGVDLFVVLSGFLITGILLDAKAAPYYYWN